MTCKHLIGIEQAILVSGASVTYRGQSWTDNCREWVYFDRRLDLLRIRQIVSLPLFIVDHENLDPKTGLERGLVCGMCKDAVVGVVSDLAQVFPCSEADEQNLLRSGTQSMPQSNKAQSSDFAPSCLGLAELALSVADLPRMQAFYTKVLGLSVFDSISMETETPDPNGLPTIVFLKMGESSSPLGRASHPPLLVLIDYQRHVFAKPRFAGHDVKSSTLNHLALEVSPGSLAGYETWLESHGIEVTHATFPKLEARSLFLRDPEQNVIELIAHDSSFRNEP